MAERKGAEIRRDAETPKKLRVRAEKKFDVSAPEKFDVSAENGYNG